MKRVGVGTRVVNFVIDTFVIFWMAYGIDAWWDFHVLYWHYPYIAFYTFFFGIMFIYYFLFESFFKRSPAKWLTFSKVVNASGNKPSLVQVLLRSLARLTIIDFLFIPFLDKPLHDYLSKTEVVQA